MKSSYHYKISIYTGSYCSEQWTGKKGLCVAGFRVVMDNNEKLRAGLVTGQGGPKSAEWLSVLEAFKLKEKKIIDYPNATFVIYSHYRDIVKTIKFGYINEKMWYANILTDIIDIIKKNNFDLKYLVSVSDIGNLDAMFIAKKFCIKKIKESGDK